MTENEAIKWLKHTRAYQHKCDNCEYIDVKGACNEECKDFYDMAIQALEEIQQIKEIVADFPLDCGNTVNDVKEIWNQLSKYLKIGTVEEFKALKEKNVAKKPNYEGDGYYGGQLVIDTWICPNCEKDYEVDYDNYDFCPNCGQHIDHSGLTEDD